MNKKDWKPRLSASSWTFVKDGLDDFRDGKPPVPDSDLILKVSFEFLRHLVEILDKYSKRLLGK